MFLTGIRAGELVGVRTVIIPKSYSWVTNKLRFFNPFGEFIFVESDDKRLTTNCMRGRMERVCDKLGIVRKSPQKVINYPHIYSDVPVTIQSCNQALSNQQKAFPIPFRQGILRADRLWLRGSRDSDSCFSCLVPAGEIYILYDEKRRK